METLRDQVETLKEAEGASWNPRGKFLVVVADSDVASPRELGLQRYVELWKEHFIIYNTIRIPALDNYAPMNGNKSSDGLREDTLDLYTGFPYEHGKCGDITGVTPMDQWRLPNGTFIHNAKVFPLKTTDNFHGCQIISASLGIPPYIILMGVSTDSDGNTVQHLGGLAVQNLLLAFDKMSVTVVFLKPSLRLAVMEVAYEKGNLVDRRSDIVIGVVTLQAVFLSP
jgi:hypothetical protein